jgi:hypothetical protein
METLVKILVYVLGILLGLALAAGLIFAFSALFAWFTMLLVNVLFTPTIIAAIFGTAKLTFWKALGLNLLAGFLFKSTSVNNAKK